MNFGNTLKTLRQETGVGQKELALYLNVSVSTVSNYEKGIHSPDLNTLSKIADFFKVSSDFLLEHTEYRYSLDFLDRKSSDGENISNMINTIFTLESQSQDEVLNFVRFLAWQQAQR